MSASAPAPPQSQPSPKHNSNSSQTVFIPPQNNDICSMGTRNSQNDPTWNALRDVGTFVGLAKILPLIATPFFTSNPVDELYLGWPNGVYVFMIGAASVLQLIWAVLFVPILLCLPLPGFLNLLLLLGSGWLTKVLLQPTQGPAVIWSLEGKELEAAREKFPDERWLFINGVAVAHHGLVENLKFLTTLFHRPVLGVHNRTAGVLFDLFECIVQRNFGYTSRSTRILYDHTKACLLDPTVKKVVLVAHSQGGIMASQVLDLLFCDVPGDLMGKLEVYTFGSAAGHLNNPSWSTTSTSTTNGTMSGRPTTTRMIRHIEHYVNSLDPVTRWGILYNVCDVLDNRFAGSIFIRMGASGHMLNQHYLGPMFPIAHQTKKTPQKHKSTNSPTSTTTNDREATDFLSTKVTLDANTITSRNSLQKSNLVFLRRESSNLSSTSPTTTTIHNANHILDTVKRHLPYNPRTTLEFGDKKRIPMYKLSEEEVEAQRQEEDDKDDALAIIGNESVKKWGGKGEEAAVDGDEVRGKSVRELSRLWRYFGGRVPEE